MLILGCGMEIIGIYVRLPAGNAAAYGIANAIPFPAPKRTWKTSIFVLLLLQLTSGINGTIYSGCVLLNTITTRHHS